MNKQTFLTGSSRGDKIFFTVYWILVLWMGTRMLMDPKMKIEGITHAIVFVCAILFSSFIVVYLPVMFFKWVARVVRRIAGTETAEDLKIDEGRIKLKDVATGFIAIGIAKKLFSDKNKWK